MSNASHALELAKAGISVFPCKPDKSPYTKAGFKDATTDLSQITSCWRRWPDALIGVPTGTANGFWVLDIDAPKDGETANGYDSLKALTAQHGELPKTRTQKTPGGGMHYFFRYPANGLKIKNSASQIGQKIDARGEGGYIIIAPSTLTDGRRYETVDESAVAETPPWLLECVCPNKQMQAQKPRKPQARAGMTPYIQAAIDRELEALASAARGTRNDTTNKVSFNAGQWVGSGALSYNEAFALLLNAARQCGLVADDGENAVRKTIASGLKAGMLEPRQAPQRARRKKSTPAPAAPPPADDVDDRPTVFWREHALPEVLCELRAVLSFANNSGRYVQLFQRGREVVIVEIGSSGTVTIRPLSAEGLSVHFATVARLVKFSERKNELVPCGVPPLVAKSFLAWAESWGFSYLKGVINAATLRLDGSVLDAPGYDANTGLFLEPGGDTFPPTPQSPTKDDAVAALTRLLGLICEFPVVDDLDRTVILAAILTVLVRPTLPTVPFFGFTAPVMASGKTLLANIVAAIATGRPAPVMSLPPTEEELGKVIFSILRSGVPVAVFDNISEPVKSDTLNAISTSETYRGRILGKSEQIELPNTTLWLFTGNNLIIRGDLATRTLICRLDPNCERPEQRRFSIDPLKYIAAHRGELVRDALTVMRAYVVAGSPDVGTLPFGRFEAWSRLVRDSLVWCGEADPTLTLERVRDEDPDRELLASVLAVWFEVFKDAKVTTKELMSTAYSNPELMEAVKPICLDRHTGEADQRSMGKWLARYSGRIVNGLKVTKAGTRNRAVQWAVIKTV